jgi:hypothetical protein
MHQSYTSSKASRLMLDQELASWCLFTEILQPPPIDILPMDPMELVTLLGGEVMVMEPSVIVIDVAIDIAILEIMLRFDKTLETERDKFSNKFAWAAPYVKLLPRPFLEKTLSRTKETFVSCIALVSV